MKPFPTLQIRRLLLRQFGPDDLENVFRGLSDPQVIKHYGVSYQSREATQAQLDWFAQLERDGTGIWWAICSPDDREFYGAGGLNNIHHEHRKGEVGFWLMPAYWRQGIMQEAMPLICACGFEQLNLHRIEANVETDNIACKAAMNRLGFRLEGTMEECEIKEGRFISLDIYAKLERWFR